MRLARAANYFNDMPCTDAYEGTFAFQGQLGLYDDTKRDSETAQRRVISVSPDITVPARRVVAAAGTHYIIGHGAPDYFKDSVVRVGLVAHEATSLATVYSLAQFCEGVGGVEAWAGRTWLKNTSFTEQSSQLNPQHHLAFSRTEQVNQNYVVVFENAKYLVRTRTVGPSGVQIALCDEMPEPVVETATTLSGQSWDPVAEVQVGTRVDLRVVRMRWQSLFAYNNHLAPTFGPGDIQLAISQTLINAAPGMEMTLSDGVWKLASADSEDGVWLCRAVRHG